MKHNEFDGFAINLFMDKEGEWLAYFVELPNVSAFGENPEKALKELKIAWKGIKQSYQKHQQTIPIASISKSPKVDQKRESIIDLLSMPEATSIDFEPTKITLNISNKPT